MTKEVHKLYVLALALEIANDPTWYVHTRATQHMCYESESFVNYQACESWQVVFLGDNTIPQIAR